MRKLELSPPAVASSFGRMSGPPRCWRLVRIPGVGKKTAERMVLELRDKLPAPAGETVAPPAPSLSEIEKDVLSALLNLGGARPAAEQAVRKAKAGTAPADFEPLFRRALELVR